MAYLKISTPRSRDTSVSIDVSITLKDGTVLPFTANPLDEYNPDSKDIYERALNGEYGGINISPAHNYAWEDGKWVEFEKSSITYNRNLKSQLINEATNAVNPLQDAIELGIARDEEIASLKKWKQYRVLLNRVDFNEGGNIEWPVKPE